MENQDDKKKSASFWDKMEGLMWLLLIYFTAEALVKWYYGSCKKYYNEKNWTLFTFFVSLPILWISFCIYNSVTGKH